MEFRKIKNTDSEEFNETWKVYEDSFSYDEKRDLNSQKKCMEKKEYSFDAVFENGRICGFAAIWEFDGFVMIEHLAVKKELRNKGIGKSIVDKIERQCKKTGKIIILETLKPETDIAARRIKFYERNCFVKNEQSYMQPSYGEGKKPVNMLIMSYPEKINDERFEEIKKKVYSNVYRIKD